MMDGFDFDEKGSYVPAKKSAASSSRRRRELDTEDSFDTALDSISIPNTINNNRVQTIQQTRRNSKENFALEDKSSRAGGVNANTISGWGDQQFDAPSTARTTSRRRDLTTGLSTDVSESLPSARNVKQRELVANNNQELEIPEIPDLEEAVEPDEDKTFKIAEAPDIQVHQISTYKELDKEFFKEKAFQFLEGNIDVSLLHCGLSTEQQIAEEEDVVWDWGKLFTEVVSILTTEKEASNGEQESAFGNADDEFGTAKNKNPLEASAYANGPQSTKRDHRKSIF